MHPKKCKIPHGNDKECEFYTIQINGVWKKHYVSLVTYIPNLPQLTINCINIKA